MNLSKKTSKKKEEAVETFFFVSFKTTKRMLSCSSFRAQLDLAFYSQLIAFMLSITYAVGVP